MATKKTVVATTKTAAKKAPAAKVAAKPAAKPAVKQSAKETPQAAAKKSRKELKEKVVRDSFTMPQSEYQKIAEIKEGCLKSGLHVKKSEVLRAGLKVLGAMSAAQLKHAIAGLEKIKTGRPKKH